MQEWEEQTKCESLLWLFHVDRFSEQIEVLWKSEAFVTYTFPALKWMLYSSSLWRLRGPLEHLTSSWPRWTSNQLDPCKSSLKSWWRVWIDLLVQYHAYSSVLEFSKAIFFFWSSFPTLANSEKLVRGRKSKPEGMAYFPQLIWRAASQAAGSPAVGGLHQQWTLT